MENLAVDLAGGGGDDAKLLVAAAGGNKVALGVEGDGADRTAVEDLAVDVA